MPELSQLKGIGLPTQTVSLLKPDWSNPVAFEPDKSGLARASVFNKLSETLADLPAMAARNITAGRKLRDDKRKSEVDAAGDAIVKDKLSKGALEGLTIGPNGTTYRAPDTETADEVEMRKLRREYLQGQIDKQGATTQKPPTIAETLDQKFGGAGPASGVAIDSGDLLFPGNEGAISDIPSDGSEVAAELTPEASTAAIVEAGQNKQHPPKKDPYIEGLWHVFDASGAPSGTVFRDKFTPIKAAAAAKPEKGRRFANIEEAKVAADKEGFDLTGAAVGPDGSITVENYKPTGTDVKGRGKITDTQKGKLDSASQLAKSIDGLLGEYDEMDKAGMAGPIAGRIEGYKQAAGVGSERGSQVQSQMNTALFKIARMLNGAGVLTDKDIARAENVAPTIKMSRPQFKGQLEAVKDSIKGSLEGWLQTNAGQATEEQVALANQAISSLSSATTKQPVQPAQMTPVQKAALEKYKSGAYDADPAKKARAEALLKDDGLL